MPRSLLASLLCLLAVSCGQDTGVLLTEVSDSRQANEILVRLIENHVHSAQQTKSKGRRKSTWQIRVNESEEFEARRVLVHFGLPRKLGSGMQDPSSGVIPTEEQERMRALRMMRDLVMTSLEDLQGIVQARVHFFLPRKKAQYRAQTEAAPSAKASVIVRYMPKSGSRRTASDLDGQPLRFCIDSLEAPAPAKAPAKAANAVPSSAASAQVAQVYQLRSRAIPEAALRRWPVHPATIANIVASNLEDVRTEEVTVTFQDASQPLLNAPSFQLVSRQELNEAGASFEKMSYLVGDSVWIDESLGSEPEALMQAYLEAASLELKFESRQERELWVFVPTLLMGLLTLCFLGLWQRAERRSQLTKQPATELPVQAA